MSPTNVADVKIQSGGRNDSLTFAIAISHKG